MADSLICTERLDVRHAEQDPVIFSDQRVMTNLLELEKKSMILIDYFQDVQLDITSNMRRIVVDWMMEVCEELKSENQVFPLAVRLMDLFLASCNTARQHLQLLGAVCLHVASKVREVNPIATEVLIYYTENSITAMDMLRVELMLLIKLNWQVSYVTASDFVGHVLSRVPWAEENPLLRRHAHLLVQLCCADHDIIHARPAAVAGGCILAAARGLRIPSLHKVLSHVCQLTQLEESEALVIESRVEALVREEEARQNLRQPSNPAPLAHSKSNCTSAVQGNATMPLDILIDEPMETSQPETPTDVQDVHF